MATNVINYDDPVKIIFQGIEFDLLHYTPANEQKFMREARPFENRVNDPDDEYNKFDYCFDMLGIVLVGPTHLLDPKKMDATAAWKIIESFLPPPTRLQLMLSGFSKI